MSMMMLPALFIDFQTPKAVPISSCLPTRSAIALMKGRELSERANEAKTILQRFRQKI